MKKMKKGIPKIGNCNITMNFSNPKTTNHQLPQTPRKHRPNHREHTKSPDNSLIHLETPLTNIPSMTIRHTWHYRKKV
jgi:hypothetical protein